MKALKIIALPFIIAIVIPMSIVGVCVYWYYWTFKPEQLYTKYGND